SWKSGSIRTATEVVSRNSRTYRTQSFYRRLMGEGLSRMAENICLLGKMAGLLSAEASDKASVMFRDGVCEDEGTRTDRAVKLYSAGLISKERALSQIYGVSVDEARAMERSDNDGRTEN
ncbi:MAG: phage portal protein, partial [Oscillospiraceae bacterium]